MLKEFSPDARGGGVSRVWHRVAKAAKLTRGGGGKQRTLGCGGGVRAGLLQESGDGKGAWHHGIFARLGRDGARRWKP